MQFRDQMGHPVVRDSINVQVPILFGESLGVPVSLAADHRHDDIEVGSRSPRGGRIGPGGRRDGLDHDSGDLGGGHSVRLEEHRLEEAEVLAQPVARSLDQQRHLWQRCCFI